MTGPLLRRRPANRPTYGIGLFLNRWTANKLRMGSIVPSSAVLCRRLVECGWLIAGGLFC
jgi:phospholipid N-methyltransferase